MEVHQHTHHRGGKNWRSYLWEFIMLFFAVFCSFLAEWQLEHTIEHGREKEFIASMLKELETDYNKINEIYSDTSRNNKLISLSIALADIDNNPENIRKAYLLVGSLGSFRTMEFNNSTINQLKFGGYFRLIRNRVVVDSLNLIDNSIQALDEQDKACNSIVLKNLERVSKIIDCRYVLRYNISSNKLSYEDFLKRQTNLQYLDNNEKLRLECAQQILIQWGVYQNYIEMLQEHQQLCKRVIGVIREEYKIEK